MAKRKTKGKSKKRFGKGVPQISNAVRIIAGFAILLLLVVSGGFLAHHIIGHEEKPVMKNRVLQGKAHKPPVFEIYPLEKSPSPAPPGSKPPAAKKLPQIAIIIDDVGYDELLAKRLLEIDAAFTFSVLPHSPFQKRIAAAAHAKGIEIMLHQPMEPLEYPAVDPGPGALLSSMTPDELIRQLEKNLNAVPHIKGVNNHMGSRMTTNPPQLRQIFSVLKKKGYFFIDSRTSSQSACRNSARLFQVPFAERSVFLDHSQNPAFIRKQIELLVKIAGRDGEAIGIAHPHTPTYNMLKKMIPDLKKRVRLVPASRLVHPIG
jgi:polysaccharide deacetylase 2 family uncharacterized protein YibQ